MTWISAGAEIRFKTPSGGTERTFGYLDRDFNAPDPVNQVNRFRSYGAGNTYAKLQHGIQTLNGNMSVVPTSSEFLYYLLSDDSDGSAGGSYQFQADTPSMGVNTHTITTANSVKPGLRPLSLDVDLLQGDQQATFYRAYTGCQFYGGTISCSTEQPIRADMQFGATGYSTDQSTSFAATVPTADPYAFYMLSSSVSLMGETITKMESFEISWDGAAKPKHYMNASDDRTPNEIVRGYGEVDFSGTLTVDYSTTGNDNAVFHLLETETPANISIVFERATNDTITFTLSNCLLESAPHTLPDTGDEVRVPVSIVPETWSITSVNSLGTYVVA